MPQVLLCNNDAVPLLRTTLHTPTSPLMASSSWAWQMKEEEQARDTLPWCRTQALKPSFSLSLDTKQLGAGYRHGMYLYSSLRTHMRFFTSTHTRTHIVGSSHLATYPLTPAFPQNRNAVRSRTWLTILLCVSTFSTSGRTFGLEDSSWMVV